MGEGVGEGGGALRRALLWWCVGEGGGGGGGALWRPPVVRGAVHQLFSACCVSLLTVFALEGVSIAVRG